ncbi:hypothetical protein Bbelb_024590 [Branchiostoma belcheri]|nr:hypothetical protein Bbelb_024590 [Branchiostoma belcheri]
MADHIIRTDGDTLHGYEQGDGINNDVAFRGVVWCSGTSLDSETGRPGFGSGSYPNKSEHDSDVVPLNAALAARKATVTTRRTCFCVLSTCKNVGKRRASVRGEYHLRTEFYGFGSTQTRRRTLSSYKTFSTCGLRIHHPCVRVRATCVPRTCRAEEAHVSTASLRILTVKLQSHGDRAL